MNMIRGTLLVSLMTSAVAATAAQDSAPATLLERQAEQARDRGEKAIALRSSASGRQPPSLAEAIKTETFWVAALLKRQPATTVGDADVTTWHLFSVEEVLVRNPVASDAPACAKTKPTIQREPTTIAVPFGIGTAVINGITVTVEDEAWKSVSDVSDGQRYLIVGTDCGDGVVAMSRGPWGVLAISSGDVILYGALPGSGFHSELYLRSISEVKMMIDGASR